jgi:hypothetical protein
VHLTPTPLGGPLKEMPCGDLLSNMNQSKFLFASSFVNEKCSQAIAKLDKSFESKEIL